MSKKPTQQRVKVLYQNLNGVWYAFADVGTHIYFGRVPVKSGPKAGEGATAASPEAKTGGSRKKALRKRRPASKAAA